VSKYFGRAFNYGIFSQKKGEIMVKRELITGASSGIGEEFARQMARDGYQVTAIARREDKLKALCTDLGNGHDYQVIDLAKMDDVKRLQQHLQNEKYDILINNAGFGYYDNFSKQDEDTLVELLDVNIKALVLLSQAFLKNAKSGDTLVNISSALGWLTFPGGAVYAGSKAFVTNFSESLWYEYRNRDIFVIAILPGQTRTEFQLRAMPSAERPAAAKDPMIQDADECVSEALQAIKRRQQPAALTNPRIRVLWNIISRFTPRRKKTEIMGKNFYDKVINN
jgi:short-subunit dehydrogenase